MNTEANPYASPTSNAPSNHQNRETPWVALDFVPIMRRWERLRLYYNGFLIPLVLFFVFIGFPDNVIDIAFWISVCWGGFIANLCFLTAPTIEAYGTHFGFWHPTLTTLLFLAGLGLTALLALWCIATYPAI